MTCIERVKIALAVIRKHIASLVAGEQLTQLQNQLDAAVSERDTVTSMVEGLAEEIQQAQAPDTPDAPDSPDAPDTTQDPTGQQEV